MPVKSADKFIDQLDQLRAALATMDHEPGSPLTASLENLGRIARQQAILLDTLAAIYEDSGTVVGKAQLLENAARLIQQNFEFETVSVYLLDESGLWLSLIAGTGGDEEPRLPVDSNQPAGKIVQQRRAEVISSDKATETLIPLLSGGQVIGMIRCGSKRAVDFSAADLRLLQILGNQLANAIENTTLLQQADQQLEQLAALHGINLQIGGAGSLQEITRQIAELSIKLVNASGSVVRLLDPDSGTLRVIAACNGLAGAVPGHVEPFDTTVSGVIIEQRRGLRLNNWSEQTLAEQCPFPADEEKPVLAVMAVPIQSQEEPIGTIEVYHYSNPQAFEENDLYILSLLGSHSAASIDKARLLLESENNRRFLKTVIQHIPDPILIKDRNHTWIEMNQANADIVGYAEAELIGRTDQDFFSPELTSEFQRRDDELFETNDILEFEDKNRWADGREHIAYTRLIPITDPAGGQSEYLLSISHDITEQKAEEAERELLLSETEVLYKGTRDISGSLSERQIFQALINQIQLIGPCEIMAYRLTNVDNEPMWAVLAAVWQKQDNPTLPIGTTFFIPDSPQSRIFTNTTPQFIESVATDPVLSDAERESIAPTAAKSLAILPLSFIGQRLGLVMVNFTQPVVFTEAIRRFWLAMIDQTGVALHNRELIQEAAYRAVQAETAAEVARVASSMLSLPDLLNSAAALIRDRFGLYYVAVYLIDDSGNWANLRASSKEVDDRQPVTDDRVAVNGNSMVARSMQERHPLLALAISQKRLQFDAPYLPETHSAMALPLLYQNRAIGAIALHSIDQSAFSKEDMIFMQTMADQLANGIENARLYRQAQLEIEQRRRVQQGLVAREQYLASQLQIQNLLLATKSNEAPYYEVLALLGEASQASRVYLFKNGYSNAGELLTTLIAEWCAEGIEPRIDDPDLINLPLAQRLPRWAELLSQGSAINNRTSDLPDAEQEFLAKYQVKATLALPVTVSGEFFGTIGFDNCTNEESWEETAQGLLSSVVAAISLWLERQRAEAELVMALKRTESLYRIGNTMATATNEQIVFEKVLLEYLQLLNLTPGQASILLFEHNKGYTRVATQLVNGETVTSNLSFPASQDRVAAYLRETEAPLVIGNVLKHKLTKDSRKFWQQTPQVRTLLFLPLVVRHRVIGAVSVGGTTADYAFTSSNIELGQIVTDQLAIWLENRQLLAETQYRSDRLQTAAEVSRAASSILGMDDLINTSVNLIRDQFQFYYVGLFLLDEAGEWAVLRAGTGKAGRIQLARHHRLKVGGESMIGWCVANRQARIALDVGQEAVHFKNPILPDTHSEMALPLISRDEVIGALTVQSVERGAFSDEDITLLQTMADQLANAITNARLFERVAEARQQAEARLQEIQVLQLLSQKLATTLNVNEVLKIFFDTCVQELGFDYIRFSLVDRLRNRVRAVGGVGLSANQIESSAQFLDSQGIMADIVRTGRTEIITGWDERFDRKQFEQEGHADWVRLFTPVALRHENIGLVEAGFKQSDQIEISDDQIKLLKAFISQTALAIENAQRYETSQQAARREALIKEITTKVRASTQLDTILQTTAREIGEAISSKRAYIQLKAPYEIGDPAQSEEGGDDEK